MQPLLQRNDVWRAHQLAPAPYPTRPTGWAALDAALPGGGWPLGALVECSHPAGTLAWRLWLPALRSASAQGQVVLLGLPLQPNAAAWAAHGIDTPRLWCVHTDDDAQTLWCAQQLLGCPSVALLWLHLRHPTWAATQRLQHAAHQARCSTDGGGAWPAPLVLLSVAEAHASPSSAAVLRLHVQPKGPEGLLVWVRKRRGAPRHHPLDLSAPWPWCEWLPPTSRNHAPTPAVDRLPAQPARACPA